MIHWGGKDERGVEVQRSAVTVRIRGTLLCMLSQQLVCLFAICLFSCLFIFPCTGRLWWRISLSAPTCLLPVPLSFLKWLYWPIPGRLRMPGSHEYAAHQMRHSLFVCVPFMGGAPSSVHNISPFYPAAFHLLITPQHIYPDFWSTTPDCCKTVSGRTCSRLYIEACFGVFSNAWIYILVLSPCGHSVGSSSRFSRSAGLALSGLITLLPTNSVYFSTGILKKIALTGLCSRHLNWIIVI